MAGEMEKIFSLSGRVHVLLRRENNRIVDVEWMTANADYAREILRVIRSTGNGELLELAQRIEALHPLLPHSTSVEMMEEAGEPQAKYLHSLR